MGRSAIVSRKGERTGRPTPTGSARLRYRPTTPQDCSEGYSRAKFAKRRRTNQTTFKERRGLLAQDRLMAILDVPQDGPQVPDGGPKVRAAPEATHPRPNQEAHWMAQGLSTAASVARNSIHLLSKRDLSFGFKGSASPQQHQIRTRYQSTGSGRSRCPTDVAD